MVSAPLEEVSLAYDRWAIKSCPSINSLANWVVGGSLLFKEKGIFRLIGLWGAGENSMPASPTSLRLTFLFRALLSGADANTTQIRT